MSVEFCQAGTNSHNMLTFHFLSANTMCDAQPRYLMSKFSCITAEHKAYYSLNHKKRDILFLTITLANLNRFL